MSTDSPLIRHVSQSQTRVARPCERVRDVRRDRARARASHVASARTRVAIRGGTRVHEGAKSLLDVVGSVVLEKFEASRRSESVWESRRSALIA